MVILKRGEAINPCYCGKCTLYLKREGEDRGYERLDLEESKTHYSYDEDSKNLHIVPLKSAGEEAEAISIKIKECRNELREKMGITYCSRGTIKGCPDALPVENYIPVQKDGYVYLLCFEQLSRTGDRIDCLLGKLQFFRYKNKKSSVNKTGKAGFLYPAETVGFDFDKESGHCIYNAELSIYDTAERIIDVFNKFVCGEIVDFETGRLKR